MGNNRRENYKFDPPKKERLLAQSSQHSTKIIGTANPPSLEASTLPASLMLPVASQLADTGEVKPKTKEKPMSQPVTAEVVIAAYIKTRDEIEAKTKALNAELAELKAIQEKRAMWLMGTMDKIGATSIKGSAGTAFIDWKDSATVSDAPAFLDWVHSDWEENKTFLENRVSKTAVKQRLEDGKTPPPGVSYTKVKDIKIRRS